MEGKYYCCEQTNFCDTDNTVAERKNKSLKYGVSRRSDFELTMASLKIAATLVFLLLLTTGQTSADSLCKWYGIGPFCFIGNTCPDGCVKVAENDKGDGMTCWFSQKKYCCCLPFGR
ncbi:unnamed protein product [Rotaria magnacalcarata]